MDSINFNSYTGTYRGYSISINQVHGRPDWRWVVRLYDDDQFEQIDHQWGDCISFELAQYQIQLYVDRTLEYIK